MVVVVGLHSSRCCQVPPAHIDLRSQSGSELVSAKSGTTVVQARNDDDDDDDDDVITNLQPCRYHCSLFVYIRGKMLNFAGCSWDWFFLVCTQLLKP